MHIYIDIKRETVCICVCVCERKKEKRVAPADPVSRTKAAPVSGEQCCTAVTLCLSGTGGGRMESEQSWQDYRYAKQ